MKNIFTCIVCCLISNISNAQSWSAVGNGVNGRVSCFAIYNGELYVGGQFNNLGGISPFGLMKWNGTAFDTLQGTYLFGSSRIEAMAVYNSELYLGGAFSPGSSSQPSIFTNIAKWNGTTFSSVGTGCDNAVYSMEVYNDKLYVGGDMQTAGSVTVNSIAKWDGSQWLSVGGGITGGGARVSELEVFNNELYAAGNFYFNTLNTSCIARWNDTSWTEVGTGGIPGNVLALGIYNNELYAGGPYFTQAGGVSVNQIARWNGTTWASAGSGIGNNVANLLVLKEYHNELYAGGTFNMMDGDSLRCIARYNSSVWDSVGTGVDSTNIIVDTLFNFPDWGDTIYIYATAGVSAFIEFNNDLYVGGSFNMIGGVEAHSVAKWSTPVGIEELSSSNSIFVYPNPTTAKIIIECNERNSFYDLRDLSGKLLLEDMIRTNKFTIDLQDFENGIYILSVINKQKQLHVKIIKQ